MVDKNLLRHYRFHGPSVAGAAEPTKAPAGAGRRVESPLGRSRFRDEVQASIDGITARKEQERERQELAKTGEIAVSKSSSRHRLPTGTTELILGAATSRAAPSGSVRATPGDAELYPPQRCPP